MITATSTPYRARSASRTCFADRSGSTGSSAAVPGLDVREVDARVGAHEPVPGLADDEIAAAAHDAHRLRLDERAAGGEVVGVERHEAAFGLRDDLLRDDDAVAVDDRRALRDRGLGDDDGQLVAGPDLADALDRDDRQRAGHGAGDGFERAARERGRDLGAVHHRVGDDARTPAASTSARAPRRPRR